MSIDNKKASLNPFLIEKNEQCINATKDLLIIPHGGELIQNFYSDSIKSLKNYSQVQVDYETILDIEQIAHGVFSPLKGFMGEKDFYSVIHYNKLQNGVAWTLPVIFQVNDSQINALRKNKSTIILDHQDRPHSLIHVKEIYQVDFNQVIAQWFGTHDILHPGIQKMIKKGNVFIAGEVFLLDSDIYQNKIFSLTPRQIRSVFNHKKWIQVVGFHSRNLPHKAHEFIQIESLNKTKADGLLISPVVGPKKKGDFLEDIVFESYELAIKKGHFPATKTFLSGFNTYSRFAGPREAIFTAICRQNMGCSFFIIGRDHTGVGNYYPPYASQELFDKIDGINIEPVYFKEIAYHQETYKFEEVQDGRDYFRLSGTELRDLVNLGKEPPEWFVRYDIVQYLIKQKDRGRRLFFE